MAVDLSALLAPPHAALVANECQRGVIGDHSLLPELARAAGPVVPAIARLAAAARRAGVLVVHQIAEIVRAQVAFLPEEDVQDAVAFAGALAARGAK